MRYASSPELPPPEPPPPELPPPELPRTSQGRGGLVLLLVVALVLGVLGLSFGTFCLGGFLARASTPSTNVVTARPTPSLIVAVRDVGRLETGEIDVEKVIDLTDTQSHLFGLIEGTDALLLVAVGRATVGVDLARVGPGDVSFDPATHTASLRLPSPDLLSVALDEDKTYVYARSTSLLARRNEHLETQARREATAAIEKAARASDGLRRSRGQAERLLRALLGPLGVERVDITWRD